MYSEKFRLKAGVQKLCKYVFLAIYYAGFPDIIGPNGSESGSSSTWKSRITLIRLLDSNLSEEAPLRVPKMTILMLFH